MRRLFQCFMKLGKLGQRRSSFPSKFWRCFTEVSGLTVPSPILVCPLGVFSHEFQQFNSWSFGLQQKAIFFSCQYFYRTFNWGWGNSLPTCVLYLLGQGSFFNLLSKWTAERGTSRYVFALFFILVSKSFAFWTTGTYTAHRSWEKLNSKIQIWWHIILFFFRAMKKGIDVESGELNQSPAEWTVFAVVRKLLSRMRFLVVSFLLQLAAFGIIKSEFYAARILFHNLTAFLVLFCMFEFFRW